MCMCVCVCVCVCVGGGLRGKEQLLKLYVKRQSADELPNREQGTEKLLPHMVESICVWKKKKNKDKRDCSSPQV